MRDFLNNAVFGWYPYLCLTVFIVGSLIRFDREQYTWRSGSSQLLRRRQLMWGSNLFHVGILVIFLGHFVGLLTPIWVFDGLGISHGFKQMLAIVVGGVAGLACLVGITLLTHRRLFDPRIRRTSSFGDIADPAPALRPAAARLATIPVSLGHLDGREMVKFMTWAQGILTLQPGVWRAGRRRQSDLQAAYVPRHDDLPGLPVHPPRPHLERAGLVSRPPRLSDRAQHDGRTNGGMRCLPGASTGPHGRSRGGRHMSRCRREQGAAASAAWFGQRHDHRPRARSRARRSIIRRHRPASRGKRAAEALVVRELLLQEAPAEVAREQPRWSTRRAGARPRRRRGSGALVEREVRVPTPTRRRDAPLLRRQPARFRTPSLSRRGIS